MAAAPKPPAAAHAGMSGIGLGMAGLGVLGSLGVFGGGEAVTNPYAGQGNGDYRSAEGDINSMTGAGLDLAHTGEGALGRYNTFAPQADQATQDELNYLKTNPYTDTYDQAQLARSTGHAMQGFAQARSALTSEMGRRGIAGPGGASSALTGADAAIAAQEAGTLGAAQNNIALDAIGQRAQNLSLANQVAQQHANSLFGEGTGATEAGSSILGNAANEYNMTGNNWLREGEQQIQDTQNANNQSSSSWAGLAGLGMKVAGL